MDVELEKEIEVHDPKDINNKRRIKTSKPLQYKLIDFGFSEYIKKGMKTIELAQLHGTPRYIAPE